MIGLLVANTSTPEQPVVFNADVQSANVEIVDGITEQYVTAMVAELADVVGTDSEELQAKTEESIGYEAQTAHIVKSQVVQTDAVTTEDISKHTVANGESLDDIAEQYGVSTDTIKWANDMTSNVVASGKELTIPPVNGVVYEVKEGDTAEKLAETYKAEADEIITFNDAELTGLVAGETIIIPDGEKPAPVVPVRRYFAAVNNASTTDSGVGRTGYGYFGNYTVLASGTYNGRSVWSMSPNKFYGGQCTWWADVRAADLGNPVANKIRGNASAWDNRAGVSVSKTPTVGAVVQTKNYGAGHVGVVEAVSSDGSMIKYSDMNGIAGRGVAAVTNDWVAVQSHWNFLR
ncbi:TPA: LysM peptidoglycan-binding domain-containing protein [Candidatus Saccharibacteria bacterium]|nr:LysM peptidoglycan-binding domain-containing protein [Candidatus Saccharibacteria bacterium]HIO87631.1 LysM peptidoglycan-binding domain-containing protein [Candidatus Saccharibacteria bacterium]